MHPAASVFIVLAFVAAPTLAQHPRQPEAPYAGMQGRDIKALSPEQLTDLREGRGMGASLPAELNGVPGPLHVLQLKDRLKVTTEQQAALERITAEMKSAAQNLGQKVIAAEGELDAAFKSNRADEATIEGMTAEIAALNGQLRAVHLVAHLQTRRLLSGDQVAAYNEARGYHVAPAENSSHTHRH
jgi:hypothetical protein